MHSIRLISGTALLTLGALMMTPLPAYAATTEPELVGSAGQEFSPLYVADTRVYGVLFGDLYRVDGDSPEFISSNFTSVGDGVGFAGALHVVRVAPGSANSEQVVVRVDSDGTVTTTLDLASGVFLGGVRALGATDSALFAGTGDTGVARTSTDGTTWSTFTNPSFFPDFTSQLVGIGSTLYARGFISGPGEPQGVFRWDGTEWVYLTIPGSVNHIAKGDDRLLVGSSEGLYSVSGTTVTPLDESAQNPRSIAEFDGAIYFIDDANVVKVWRDGTVTTPFPQFTAARSFTATDTELYFAAAEGQTSSTYRITILPTAEPEPEAPELVATGVTAAVTPLAGIAITLTLLGVALTVIRSRRSRESLATK